MRIAGGRAPVHSRVGSHTRSREAHLSLMNISCCPHSPGPPLTCTLSPRVRRAQRQCPQTLIRLCFLHPMKSFTRSRHRHTTSSHRKRLPACLTACRFSSCFSDNSAFVNRITNVMFVGGVGFHCTSLLKYNNYSIK